MADPRIQLTAYLPNNTQPSVGELVLGDPAPQDKCVVIYGRYSPQPYGAELLRFIDIRMHITSQANVDVPWGIVTTDAREIVQFGVVQQSPVAFKWHLGHANLEAIERERAGARYVTFYVAVEALALVAGATQSELHPVGGQGQIRLSVTDWEDKVLIPLGYRVPPSWDRLMAEPERRQNPGWSDAEKRLDEARKSLRRGEARDALGAVLDAFESILSKPFDSAQWKAKVKNVPEDALPEQKRDAIADMLAGFCTYLNRVGHHRGRQAPSATTTLPAMPVDQWEADHITAVAHFLLPMALRLVEAAPSTAAQPPPNS